jgi:hypothetical protein
MQQSRQEDRLVRSPEIGQGGVPVSACPMGQVPDKQSRRSQATRDSQKGDPTAEVFPLRIAPAWPALRCLHHCDFLGRARLEWPLILRQESLGLGASEKSRLCSGGRLALTSYKHALRPKNKASCKAISQALKGSGASCNFSVKRKRLPLLAYVFCRKEIARERQQSYGHRVYLARPATATKLSPLAVQTVGSGNPPQAAAAAAW